MGGGALLAAALLASVGCVCHAPLAAAKGSAGCGLAQVLRLRGAGPESQGGGGSRGAGGPGGHSSVFLQDTRRRQSAASTPGSGAAESSGRPVRTVYDILEGAIERGEGRMVHGKSKEVGGGLSVKELKLRIKDLGVPQNKIDACFERAQLEDLLKHAVDAFGGDTESPEVRGRPREDASDSDEAVMRKAAVSLGDPVRGHVPQGDDSEDVSDEEQERQDILDRMREGQESKADQAFIDRLAQTGSGARPKGSQQQLRPQDSSRPDALPLESGSSEDECEGLPEVHSSELGPAIEIREGLPEDGMTEDGRVRYAEKHNKAGYDARAVSNAQSLYEAGLGSDLPLEERILMERDQLLKRQSVAWLRSELLSLNVDIVGITEKWELVVTLRSHPQFDWSTVPGYEKVCKRGVDLEGRDVGKNATENERFKKQPRESRLPPKVEAYESSDSSTERRRYGPSQRKRQAQQRAEKEAAAQGSGDPESELRRATKRFRGEYINTDKKRQFAESFDPLGSEGKIRVHCNDRLGWKTSVLVRPCDTIGHLKVLLAQKMAKNPRSLKLQKWDSVYKDHITLSDYEIHDGFNMELYYETGAIH